MNRRIGDGRETAHIPPFFAFVSLPFVILAAPVLVLLFLISSFGLMVEESVKQWRSR